MTWLHAPIKKVADVESGFGFPKQYQGVLDAEYPFYKVGDMNLPGNESEMRVSSNTISKEVLKILQAKVFPPGTVIFPKIGAAIATNKKRILTKPSVVDNNVMGLIPKEGIESWFLFYWMQQFDLRSVTNIGPVPSMRKSEVEEVNIPLPTPSEQRRIVEILDQVAVLRKERSKADARAVRILPALFYQMFGDPLLNTKGFQKVCLSEVGIAEINPRSQSQDLPNDLEVSFVPMADVNEDWGLITGRRIKKLAEVKKGFTSFLENDVLFAKITPCMENGKAVIARGLNNGFGYGSTEFHVLRAGDLVTPEWIYGLIRLDIFRNIAKGNFIGSVGQQRVPADFLRSFRVPLPPKELIKKFSIVVREMLQESEHRRESEKRISQLVQITMRHAFSGKLTESWRTAHLKEVFQEMEHQARAST